MRAGSSIAAAAFRAVANAFGEAIRIVPMISDEYTENSPDPERAPVDTRATVSLSPSVDNIDGARQGRKIGSTTRFAGRDASIWFPPDVYAGIGYCLRPGDLIILVERAGEPHYSVAREPVSSDRGDVAVHLVLEGIE